MSKKKTESTPLKSLIAGGLAGSAEAFIMYPTEFTKTQLQLTKKPDGSPMYKGPIHAARVITQERGFTALYNGVSTLVIGSFLKAGVRFATYDTVKNALTKDGKNSQWMTMLSGLIAGVTEAVIAVTPTETIKTKLIHDRNQPNPKYKGLVHGIQTMVKEEGFAGIYRGVVPTMAKQGCNQAVRFLVYNNICDFFTNYHQRQHQQTPGAANASQQPYKRPGWVTTIAGAVAGAVSVYATMPFDTVKTRMQGLERQQYKGTWDCFQKIYAKEGVLAYWRGTVPRLSRVMCSSSIIFYCYETAIAALNKMDGTTKRQQQTSL